MDPVEKAIRLFHHSIETRATYGEALALQLASAAELLVSTLVSDSRLFVCGHGNSLVTAQQFATLLLNQGSRERPALPVLMLDTNSATLTAISQSYGFAEIFSRQIQTLGKPNDLLVIYSTTGNPQTLINALQAAHGRGMRVLCFSGHDGGNLAQLLDRNDLEIRIPVVEEFLILEMHLLATFILSELIDDTLFGGDT